MTESDINGVVVELTADPDFAPMATANIDIVTAGAIIKVDSLSLRLSASFLPN